MATGDFSLIPAKKITSPHDAGLDALGAQLAELSPSLDTADAWPAEQLRLCGEAGVFEWFAPQELGGQAWHEADLLRAYVELAAACLTTTLGIPQRLGAKKRIATGESAAARQELLPDLISGRTFATVGISHLTTSRQHLSRPVLRAEEGSGDFLLDGYSPWVTGAEFAQHVVLGATLGDGRQVLLAVPTNLMGVRIDRAPLLVGLSASRTGRVQLEQVRVPRKWLLAGPAHDVMKHGFGARTGGHQTSALAIGLATSAIDFLQRQSDARAELVEPADALIEEREALMGAMLQLAGDTAVSTAQTCLTTSNELRTRANSLALRASQAALAAAKGAGYVVGHPAGRWCREALFFLVWSCPQPVLHANLCELAGIQE